MGFFDQDTLEMLDVYLLETLQLLEKMDQVLMESENSGSISQEDMNSIFRVMHTIKSSSAMMGLPDLSEMAHSLEDLFALLRDNNQLLKGWESEFFDFLFRVSDFIRNETGRMEQEDYQPQPIEEMKTEIGSFLKRMKEKEPEEMKPVIIQEKREASLTGIRVFFEQDCKMENVRAFMLLRQIQSRIPEAKSIPEDPEKNPQALEIIREKGVLILVEPSRSAETLEVIKQGLFVSRCEIEEAEKPKKEKRKAEIQEADTGKNDAAAKIETEYLNVRMDRLDYLQNLTGELMLSMSSLRDGMKKAGFQDLDERLGHSVSQLLDELENTVTDMRMVPVSQIVPKLKRIVRDVGSKQKKKIDLVVTGEDADADKNIVERLYEAALHVIRNAADHGIEPPEERTGMGKPETGRIEFNIKSAGGEMIVRICDDGRGMDEEMLRRKARDNHLFTKPEEEYTLEEIYELSTLPGLSTKESVNEYSGRGVGMDVVRRQVEDIGGHLNIESKEGEGTSIILTLPLTYTIIENVQFRASGRAFEIPARQVDHFLEFDRESPMIKEKHGRKFVVYENKILPILDIADFYGISFRDGDRKILIHIQAGDREACLLADEILGEEKVVLKPLPALFGPRFRRRTGMNGCSVMGNGEICISVDGEILIRLIEDKDGRGRKDGKKEQR